MIHKFNYIFNGTQKEMEEFINKCDNYIDVPIAKWGDFNVVYNKLDGMFQEGGTDGWADIYPYFDILSYQRTLDDITLMLNELNAPNEFIDKLCKLLLNCKIDTYKDIDEDEAYKINKMRNEYEFEIDTNKYKMYMNKNDNENKILGFDPTQLDILNSDNKANVPYEHLNDDKFFIDYDGKTMKHILENRGLGEYWSYCNTDTHEVVEAPDNNWLSNIIFELYEIQDLPKGIIISLLEEYFIERKKGIINEWRQLAARYLDLFPEEYEKYINN